VTNFPRHCTEFTDDSLTVPCSEKSPSIPRLWPPWVTLVKIYQFYITNEYIIRYTLSSLCDELLPAWMDLLKENEGLTLQHGVVTGVGHLSIHHQCHQRTIMIQNFVSSSDCLGFLKYILTFQFSFSRLYQLSKQSIITLFVMN